MKYIALDQHGCVERIADHPRTALMERYYTSHAEKIYVDTKEHGKRRHVGYIVRGHWFYVYRTLPFKEAE